MIVCKKVVLKLISVLLFTVISFGTVKAGTLTLSAGTGLDEILIQSGNIASTSAAGLLYETSPLIDQITLFEHNFELSLEFAGYQLQGLHRDIEDEMEIYHIKPKLKWLTQSNMHLDVGLGLASFSQQYWEEITFSGTNMFALSFGIGWQFGELDQLQLDLVYNHYSNGYTRSPNPGLDLVTLNIGYSF